MKEIGVKDFATEVKDGNVVVDFFGLGCGNCKMLETILTQLESDNSNIKFLKINTDGAGDMVDLHGVSTLPTLLFFKKGEMVEKIAGLKPKVIIAKKLAEVFG